MDIYVALVIVWVNLTYLHIYMSNVKRDTRKKYVGAGKLAPDSGLHVRCFNLDNHVDLYLFYRITVSARTRLSTDSHAHC